MSARTYSNKKVSDETDKLLLEGTRVKFDLTANYGPLGYAGQKTMPATYVGKKGNWMMFMGTIPEHWMEENEIEGLVYRLLVNENGLKIFPGMRLVTTPDAKMNAEAAGPQYGLNLSLYNHIQETLRKYHGK